MAGAVLGDHVRYGGRHGRNSTVAVLYGIIKRRDFAFGSEIAMTTMTTRTVLRALAPRWRRIVRGFQSRAEHTAGAREVVRTRMLRRRAWGLPARRGAFPGRHVVRRLPHRPPQDRGDAGRLSARRETPAAASIKRRGRSPRIRSWPIRCPTFARPTTKPLGRAPSGWRAAEALDALTADVAYTYTDGLDKGLVLVTGGHYHSLSCRRTMPTADVTLRSTSRRPAAVRQWRCAPTSCRPTL